MTPPEVPAAMATNSLVEHYEQLRSRVVAGTFSGPRHGLALVLQKGMATWMLECVRCCGALEASTPPSSMSTEQAIADEGRAELVGLLASMTSRLAEVYV